MEKERVSVTSTQGLRWVSLSSWPLIQRSERKGSPRLAKVARELYLEASDVQIREGYNVTINSWAIVKVFKGTNYCLGLLLRGSREWIWLLRSIVRWFSVVIKILGSVIILLYSTPSPIVHLALIMCTCNHTYAFDGK